MNYFTTDQGLSQNSVISILQDHRGILWFGTQSGLNRFDAYTFGIYKRGYGKGLSGDYIRALAEDSSGILWIGTKADGLNRFNPISDTYQNFFIPSEKLSDNSHEMRTQAHTGNIGINALAIDQQDRVWIGTDEGLHVYDKQLQRIKKFTLNLSSDNMLDLAIVTSLLIDGDLIWIGSERGLFSFNLLTHQLLSISSPVGMSLHKSKDNKLWLGTTEGVYEVVQNVANKILHTGSLPSLSHNWVRSIKEDKQGNLWIGTNHGLNYYNSSTNKLHIILSDPAFPEGINNNTIDEIFIDKDQVLWIGTNGGGLNKLPLSTLRFLWYRQKSADGMLNENGIYGFYEDNQGYIWVQHTGLQRFDPVSGNFDKPYKSADGYDPLAFQDIPSVNGMDHQLWLGSTGFGLIRYDYVDNRIVYYKKETFKGLPSDAITKVFVDKDKVLWVYTNKGLVYLDKEKNQFRRFNYQQLNTGQLSKQNIHQLIKTSTGELWLATGKGVYRFNNHQLIQHYLYHDNDENSLSSDTVNDLLEDNSGNIWVATNFGLNKFDLKNNHISRYFKQQGLVDNAVSGIAEDHDGRLWITTINGLSLYNPLTDEFRNYYQDHGLQANEFNMGAIYVSRDNKILLGGVRGFNLLNASSFNEPLTYPLPLIMSLITSKKPGIPTHSWYYPDNEIILDWQDNDFTIHFTSLDSQFPQRQLYYYFLSGFEPQWIETNVQRRFTYYSNLNPGQYTFRISTGLNENHEPYGERRLHITVTTPWWRTSWAYSLYCLIILGFIYLLVTLRTLYLQQRAIKLEKIVNERTLKISQQKAFIEKQTNSLEKLLQRKNIIFANISHEFRTPLTLILEPLKHMLKIVNKNQQKELNMVQRNAYRLLRMVDQLLDISHLQSLTELEEDKRSKEIINLGELLEAVIPSYQIIAHKKDIKLKIRYEKPLFVNMHYDEMEKIIGNLLSNAIKYTLPGGVVNVQGNKQQGRLLLSVQDNGIGIPDDVQDKIFEHFVRVNDDITVGYNKGTGIGLALVKEIVESHYGQLQVNSLLGKGSEFIVSLPLSEVEIENSQVDLLQLRESTSLEVLNLSSSIQQGFTADNLLHGEDSKNTFTQKSSLLIVDDNPDMRHYLHKILVEHYECHAACNGLEATDKARVFMPNIIISDIMMPDLDGYQFCRKLKEDYLTSHIPLIFLTALHDRDSRLIGLKEKTDDYLTKPFDSEELLLRIENLLSIRESLMQRMRLKLNFTQFSLEEEPVNIKDQEFIDRLNTMLEKNYTEAKLNFKLIARNLCITERQLQRKLKAMFGQNAGELLRTYRIEKAIVLLKQGFRVEDVAYKVGFGSRNYFGTCFKAYMGKNPKQFQQDYVAKHSANILAKNKLLAVD